MARNSEPQHWLELCESKYLLLMHLYMMVFKQYLGKKTQRDFIKKVLSDDITWGIDFNAYKNASSNLLRKIPGQVSQADFSEIRNRLRNPEMVAFDKQNQVLRDLEKPSVGELWGAMNAKHPEIKDNSYLAVFKECSPWLFNERNLDYPSEDMIYRLLTVAIFISVNQQTGSGDKAEDELDILCEKYLEEQIPEFSLRTLYDTLFANHTMFAIKRGDYYAAVASNDLTDLDRINILFPNIELLHSFTLEKEEDAKKLLDNQIDQETTRQVLGFFGCYGANVWSILVSHIHETFARCQLAAIMKTDKKRNKEIESALNKPLDKNSRELIKAFRSQFEDEDGNSVCWISDICDSFWGGGRAACSLPPVPEKEEFDAKKLCECIAAYLLIAVYCLKMNGSAVPLKRRKFRKKLEAQISKVFFDNNQGSVELLREKDQQLQEKDQRIAELELKLVKERTDNLKIDRRIRKPNLTIDTIVAILDGVLNDMHLGSPIKRREYIEDFCRRTGLTLDQIPEFDKLVNGYDDPKIRRLTTDSADWGNGGIK